jgi:excisionase family DNA binding protein
MVRSVLVEQAAALLGVSRRTIYYRIRDGRLETIRTRCGSQRVLMRSIEQLLREDEERRALRGRRRRRRRSAAAMSPAPGELTAPDAAV